MILSLWESWSKTNGMSRGKICSNLGQGQFWNYISVKSFQSDAMCPEQDWSKRQRWALRTSPEGQEQSDRVQVQEAFWPSPAAVSAQWTVRAVDLESWNSLTREVLGKLQIILTFCGLWSFGRFFFFFKWDSPSNISWIYWGAVALQNDLGLIWAFHSRAGIALSGVRLLFVGEVIFIEQLPWIRVRYTWYFAKLSFQWISEKLNVYVNTSKLNSTSEFF